MESCGIEYRVLQDAAGKNFKVEINDYYFMGFKKWRPLMGWFKATHMVQEQRIRYFDSCEDAKQAAIEYCEKITLKSGWTECKC